LPGGGFFACSALDRDQFFLLFEGVADPECDREPAERQTRSDHQRERRWGQTGWPGTGGSSQPP
jgi:hypothetical protein